MGKERVVSITTRFKKKSGREKKVLIFSKTSIPVSWPIQTSNPMGVRILPESYAGGA
jgi:hypothetical protein